MNLATLRTAWDSSRATHVVYLMYSIPSCRANHELIRHVRCRPVDLLTLCSRQPTARTHLAEDADSDWSPAICPTRDELPCGLDTGTRKSCRLAFFHCARRGSHPWRFVFVAHFRRKRWSVRSTDTGDAWTCLSVVSAARERDIWHRLQLQSYFYGNDIYEMLPICFVGDRR